MPCARWARQLSTHSGNANMSASRWAGWQPVIGIEVHAQIKSRRKLFSGKLPYYIDLPHTDLRSDSFTDLNAEENVSEDDRVSLFDAAFPGTLPVCPIVFIGLTLSQTKAILVVEIQQDMSRPCNSYLPGSASSGPATIIF